MADIFVSRMRKLCNSMSEAIYVAAESEKAAREVGSNASELVEDVSIIAKTTHHMEDELTQTQQQISAIEHELVAVSSRQHKTEKIANELNSRFLHVQSDVQNQRIELEKREDKLKKMKEFLEQGRQQQKIDNKQLTQLDELNDSYDKELKTALQQAEDYTVKYEEIMARIKTLETQLIKQNNKGDKAEEKAELNQEIVAEKKEAVKQMEIENIEHSANEDNIMEQMRQLREKLFHAEERFKFANKKEVELQDLADDLSHQYSTARDQLSKLKKN
jgi:chromosome segregation ATPase